MALFVFMQDKANAKDKMQGSNFHNSIISDKRKYQECWNYYSCMRTVGLKKRHVSDISERVAQGTGAQGPCTIWKRQFGSRSKMKGFFFSELFPDRLILSLKIYLSSSLLNSGLLFFIFFHKLDT